MLVGVGFGIWLGIKLEFVIKGKCIEFIVYNINVNK